MMKEQVYAQAALLAGELDSRQQALLRLLCDAAVSMLSSRLREGITVEDCRAEFVAAASLYALADLHSTREDAQVEEFKAGDLTVKQGAASYDVAARHLQQRAERMMVPYLKDCFSFLGV